MVLLTATVTAGAIGTVTFYDGAIVLGTGRVVGGTASLSTPSLAAGNRRLTAYYGGDANFGVRTDRFGFTITGSNDLVIVVEASTSLINPDWTPVSTNTLAAGSSYFSDPQWASFPSRFYRFRSP